MISSSVACADVSSDARISRQTEVVPMAGVELGLVPLAALASEPQEGLLQVRRTGRDPAIGLGRQDDFDAVVDADRRVRVADRAAVVEPDGASGASMDFGDQTHATKGTPLSPS